jgi:hypothetical protein
MRPGATEVFVGDKAGRLVVVDIRTMKECAHLVPGSGGSIRSLDLHPTLPYLAVSESPLLCATTGVSPGAQAVGLDRTARVYNTESRKLRHTFYLKQRQTALLFDKEEALQSTSSADGDVEAAQDDDDEAGEGLLDEIEGDQEPELYEDMGSDLSDALSDEDEEDSEDDDDGGDGGGKGGSSDDEDEDEDARRPKTKKPMPRNRARGGKPGRNQRRRK